MKAKLKSSTAKITKPKTKPALGVKGAKPAAGKKRPAKPTLKANGRPGTPERKAPRRLTPAEADALFAKLAAVTPIPKSELEFINPYTLLVAVVLSAQATDVGVNKATRRLFPAANTPQAMLALGEDGLKRYVSSIGLYNAKAKNIIALSQQLLDLHGGEVPHDRDALQALPGVGRKSANVILNVVFGEPTIAVDTHIFRVANRTGLAPGKDVRAVEAKLEKVVPPEFLMDAHHWLVLHGRYVCKARKPDCPHCVIRDLCRYKFKTPAE
jgi:endonuclease-3